MNEVSRPVLAVGSSDFEVCGEMAIFVFSKKNLGKLGLIFFLFLLLTSCVTTREEFLYLNDQIGSLNKRVNTLHGSIGQDLSKELDSRFQSVRH